MKDISERVPSLLRLAEGLGPAQDVPHSDTSSNPPAAEISLDPGTVRDTLGPRPDPHHIAMLKLDVMAAVAWLEAEIRTGSLGPAPLLVRGRPLADWLDLGALARLLRAGKRS